MSNFTLDSFDRGLQSLTQSPNFGQILDQLQLFLTQGDSYLRANREVEVVKLLIGAKRQGLDVAALIQRCMPDLQNIDRLKNRLQTLWAAAFYRIFSILVLLVVVRMALLFDIDSWHWSSWLGVDRVCSALGILSFFAFAAWGTHRYLRRGWCKEKEQWIWQVLQEYVQMGSIEVRDANVARDLMDIRRGEVRFGIDGRMAGDRLLRGQFLRFVDEIELELSRLGLVFLGLELVSFAVGAVGFNLVPFLAWAESASGA